MKGPKLYIRGRLCQVYGWVEGSDPSVGIMSQGFCIERIEPLDDGPPMFSFLYNPDGSHTEDLVLEDLFLNEAQEIERVFWTEQEKLQTSHEVTYSWQWHFYDPLMISEFRGERSET